MGSEWLLGRLAGGCGVDLIGSGLGSVAGCCKCGDEPTGSGATELVRPTYIHTNIHTPTHPHTHTHTHTHTRTKQYFISWRKNNLSSFKPRCLHFLLK
jgi:hypothetical protein